MTRFAADVIDSVLGISEGSPLHQLRARRPEARARTQSSYAVLFNPPDPGGLSPPERFAVALRVAELHDAPSLAAQRSPPQSIMMPRAMASPRERQRCCVTPSW